MSKICQLHPTSPRYRKKCLECHRKNAREWNEKNRQLCKERNATYHKEKKEMIATRKNTLYKNSPEKYKMMARRYALRAKYGLSLEDYANICKAQKGLCAICGKKEIVQSNKKGATDSLRVDHCHKTGKNRGLLCSRCNLGLGLFCDDAGTLDSARKYLKRWGKLLMPQEIK